MVNNITDANIISVWCALKEYSRGLLIQAAAREKRQRVEMLNRLLTDFNL